jgi:excisionase family DNA binding protein
MHNLLDVAELADLLSISPWTVRAYVKQGKLMPVRIGRRVLFEEEELNRFIEACKQQGVSRGR